MQREISALVEAVRLARTELQGLRDPQRQLTAERAVRRLSRVLESKELEQAMSRLQTEEDSPPIAPTENVDLRVPYPWRSH